MSSCRAFFVAVGWAATSASTLAHASEFQHVGGALEEDLLALPGFEMGAGSQGGFLGLTLTTVPALFWAQTGARLHSTYQGEFFLQGGLHLFVVFAGVGYSHMAHSDRFFFSGGLPLWWLGEHQRGERSVLGNLFRHSSMWLERTVERGADLRVGFAMKYGLD